MAPLPTNPATITALKDAIQDGTYPNSEAVLVADLSDDAVEPLLQYISQAQAELTEQIRQSDSENVTDVDTWIEQAKRVQEDIAQCKEDAKRIVEQHERLESLRKDERNAAQKVEFLKHEIDFTRTLSNRLNVIATVAETIRVIDDLLLQRNAIQAAYKLSVLGEQISGVAAPRTRGLVERLRADMSAKCTAQIEETLQDRFVVQRSDNAVTLKIESEMSNTTPLTSQLFEALLQLHPVSELRLASVHRIAMFLLQPLKGGHDRRINSFSVDRNKFTVHTGNTLATTSTVLDFVRQYLTFVQTHCPSRMLPLVAGQIHPQYITSLTTKWLVESIPIDLVDLSSLKTVQRDVAELAQSLESAGWIGSEELTDWVENAPRLWLAKRKAHALDAVRKGFTASQGTLRQVERIERQMVENEVSSTNPLGHEDDWDAGWDEDKAEIKETSLDQLAHDEDASGWGFDDDEDETDRGADIKVHSPSREVNRTPKKFVVASASNGTETQADSGDNDNDESDAWGWDEEPVSVPDDAGRIPVKAKRKPAEENGKRDATTHEVTMTEIYSITDVPDYLVEVIGKDIYDSQDVQNVSDPILQSPAVSAALLALPTLALAMFRATAPTFYSGSGHLSNMNLYNDSMYIVEKMQGLRSSSSVASIEADCKAMERFAKSAYAKEMEVQRTILIDLLDGAQGFSSCTKFPYSQEIERAVTGTVDRMRHVHTEWQPVLSTSALLQSLGALLSGVIAKIITDIEEMEDISEPESERLTSLCGQIASLEDLFFVQPPESQRQNADPVSMTALYVPNWLRFQYLINILESSLVDIGYLWTDGELSLEYSADEVIDLIKALFAESNHRRTAISTIRSHPAKS